MVTRESAIPVTDVLERVWERPPGFVGWLSAVNHKAVGMRYIITGSVFFLLAGVLALVMRIQLALPELALLSPEIFNQFFTMHGTTMMFLFAVPIMEGIGMYFVPLMIGARDMIFPRLNALGYWVYLIAGVTLYGSLIFGRAPDGGWFAYPPFTGSGFSRGPGLDFWVTAITFLEVAALVAAVEIIVTVLKLRAPGMSMGRAPLFVWSQLVMSVMIVFAMPALIAASVMLGLDRMVGTHFFNPGGGGDPVLWQHLFWIFGHPEVYIILVPALGIISMIVPVAARRRLSGYTLLVASFIAIGFLSFGLWVHHMFAAGLPFTGMSFFAAASMMIAVPSGVQVFAYIATIWQGQLRVTTSFLYVVGFMIIFVIGGMTGVMVASIPFDWQVHDTYFVVAHFHYVLIGGAVFPLLAGAYFYFPKLSGRLLSERLGKWSFWLVFLGTHVTFFPMHELGFAGMPRRVYTYLDGLGWGTLNFIASVGAFVIAAGVLMTLVNVGWSLLFGRKSGRDPWEADTLDWTTDSPPAVYNFETVPEVRSRHPLWDDSGLGRLGNLVGTESPRRETLATTILDARPAYRRVLPGPSLWPLALALALALSFIGSMADLAMVPFGAVLAFLAMVGWLWPTRHFWQSGDIDGDDETGLPTVVAGTRSPEWWGVLSLIVIEGVVFASFIASYFFLRSRSAEWPQGGIDEPGLLLASINAAILVASVVPVWWGTRAIARGQRRRFYTGFGIAVAMLSTFLALKFIEIGDYDYDWSTNAYGSIVFLITGLHITHVFAVLLKTGTVAVHAYRGLYVQGRHAPVEANALYWYFVAGIWVPLFATLYLGSRL